MIYQRYFKYVDHLTGQSCGRYVDRTPRQAAKKCASMMFQRMKHQDFNMDQPVEFYIKECSRGTRKKHHYYRARRLELNHPQTVSIHGGNGQIETIIFKHYISIKKLGVFKTLEGNLPKENSDNSYHLETKEIIIPNKLVIEI